MVMERIDPGTNKPEWPASGEPKDIGFHVRRRIRWLAPGGLVRTGFQVFVAQKFAEFLDRRELQGSAPAEYINLSATEDGELRELWVDYVADTGDGFDATATIASQLARETIELPDGTVTHAGALLVLGGDQVYPTASPQAYQDRLIGPFRAMLPWTDQPRRVVALPGNHDWYDGLTSFLRTFCQHPEGRWIGGWKTQQSRSYWAVKLPQGWWLWGIDVQLSTLIDAPQLSYFKQMAGCLEEGDAVILCWAKPIWTEATADSLPESYNVLDYFERTVIGDRERVRVTLAGDTHHYARFAPADPRMSQKITAGGGGAYLSATHTLRREIFLPPLDAPDADPPPQPVRHELVTTYPDAGTSRRLTLGVLGSIYANGALPAIPAVLYAIIGVLVGWTQATADQAGGYGWATVAPALVTLAALALVGVGLWLFAEFSSRPPWWKSVLLAVTHLALHAIAINLAVSASRRLDWPLAGSVSGAGLVAGLAGLLLGPLVMAVYLLIAQIARVNVNELFSAMAIEDYKCFLRLHVAADRVTIYPFKIERIARWTFAPEPEATAPQRWFNPNREPRAELIEPQPIVVPKRAGAGPLSERT